MKQKSQESKKANKQKKMKVSSKQTSLSNKLLLLKMKKS